MCYLDVCIGAGAKNVKADSPLSIAVFTICIASFFFLICYVGMRAKKKLMALEEQGEDAAEKKEEPESLKKAKSAQKKWPAPPRFAAASVVAGAWWLWHAGAGSGDRPLSEFPRRTLRNFDVLKPQ